MSWLLYIIVAIPVVCIVLFYYIKQKLLAWENYMYSNAPSLKYTHEEMVKVAKEVPRDNNLTDEQFDMKYNTFRHEVFRAFTMKKRSRELLNDILHYLELYIRHGGPSSLKKKIKINKPIFIIGDFRSGTSVLERIIYEHPDVRAFTFSHMLLWKAPYYWDRLYDLFQTNRENAGHPAAFGKNGKGLYSPHSSNNLLHRQTPWENEVIWANAKQNLFNNRDFNWDNLDDPIKCKDNIDNQDILDENYNDKRFETQLKNTIRMLLADYGGKRFINKNPLNGYRVGYLKKIFPDAKFIHIRRNPIKTCQSQVLMNNTFCRTMYIDDPQWRRDSLAPKPLKDVLSNKKHWSYMTSGHHPNGFIYQTWMPRIWPRTKPYQLNINKYLKQDKLSCATAVGVCQHESAALNAYKRLNFKEGKDILYIWHEDVIEDALLASKKVFEFLEININDKELIKYLEKQGFPNGKANKTRVKFSRKKNDKPFNDETEECLKILEPVLKPFRNRTSIYDKWGEEDTMVDIN